MVNTIEIFELDPNEVTIPDSYPKLPCGETITVLMKEFRDPERGQRNAIAVKRFDQNDGKGEHWFVVHGIQRLLAARKLRMKISCFNSLVDYSWLKARIT